ncbi:MAG: alpha/beta fold hydrolase [Cellvibrionaceae bacterium]
MGTPKRTFEGKREPFPNERANERGFSMENLQTEGSAAVDSRLLDFQRTDQRTDQQSTHADFSPHSETSSAESSQQQEEDSLDGELDEEFFAKLEKLRSSAEALRGYSEDLRTRYGQTAAADSPDRVSDADFTDLRGKGLIDTLFDFTLQVFKQPQVFAKRYASFATELLHIAQSKSELQPERGDRRFRDAVWQDNPVYRMLLQSYLAWDKEVNGLIDDLTYEDERDKNRAQFVFTQISAAMAPSNSPLNPVAIKRAYQTGGKSVLAGLQNLSRDFKTNHGMPRQSGEDAYQVGKDLGTTPGAVVYRSKLFELIQYQCAQNSLVHQRPVLVVPPQINKFYIFDLSPKNSVVDYLRGKGLQVFMISWKNPTKAEATWGLDTYLEELDKGVEAVLDISGSEDLNLISACAGGITAVSLQALYATLGKSVVRNHSLLVTALSVEGHPTLDLFMDKRTVSTSLARSRRRGVMEGKELAHVFAWLRPTDLVWSFWVNNNLLGKEPPTMDVLYWDNDSTRLPAALHHDFMDTFLNNRFVANSLSVGGLKLDLGKVEGDFYFLGGDEDYLMPWKNCFGNPDLFANANCRFVLSNSGHIQSVLRPPGIASSSYYTGGHLDQSPEDWLASAQQHKGSWWEDWAEWLGTRSAPLKKAPKRLGNERYPPICASPGTYVLEK